MHEDLDYFRVEPIEIDTYVMYLILKLSLTEDERAVYKTWYFRKYDYSDEHFASSLGFDIRYYMAIRKKLEEKIKETLKDKYLYNAIKEEIAQKYGYGIFTLDLDKTGISLLVSYVKSERMLNENSLEYIVSYIDNSGIDIPNNIRTLIYEYYYMPRSNSVYYPSVNRDVNMAIYGFKRNSLPIDCLYQTFQKHINEFSEEQIKNMRIYVDAIRTNREPSEYEGYSYLILINLISHLEKMYFGFSNYVTYHFSKEKYKSLREACLGKLDKQEIDIMDKFYLMNKSTQEIADLFGLTYEEAHSKIRVAREKVLALELKKKNKKEVDPKIYVAILESEDCKTCEKNKDIALLFYREGWTYEEISQKYGITVRQVSNIITDLLWNMDFHRFGLVKKRKYDPSIVESVLESYCEIEKRIIKDVLNGKGYSDFKDEYQYERIDVSKLLRKFYKKCYMESVKQVKVTSIDIGEEVLAHPSKNILRDNEKQYFALRYGIKCEFNPDGKIYTIDEILNVMNLRRCDLNKIIGAGLESIAGKKLGLVRSNLDCIDRRELEKLLEDRRIPISDKDRFILCSVYEICGNKLMTLEEVSKYYSETELSIKRRILRSLVTIKRYQNGEIDKDISFSEDVKPYLKYFSKSDRQVLTLRFQEEKSYSDISKIIGLTTHQVISLMLRLEVFLKLLRDKEVVGIDFDYFYKVIDIPSVPFYGDKEIAKRIFHMYYEERKSAPRIIEELNLPFKETSFFKILDNIVLSVYKYKMGIRKAEEYTYEQIRSFFLSNQESMDFNQKLFYLRYFERVKNEKVPFYIHEQVSPRIILDMIKSQKGYCFDLDNSTKEEAMDILRKYKNQLNGDTISAIMAKHGITGRELMNGSDKMKIIRAISHVREHGIEIHKSN